MLTKKSNLIKTLIVLSCMLLIAGLIGVSIGIRNTPVGTSTNGAGIGKEKEAGTEQNTVSDIPQNDIFDDLTQFEFTTITSPYLDYKIPKNSKMLSAPEQIANGYLGFSLNEEFEMEIILITHSADYEYVNVTGGQPPRVAFSEEIIIEIMSLSDVPQKIGEVKGKNVYRAYDVGDDIYIYFTRVENDKFTEYMDIFIFENRHDSLIIRFNIDENLSDSKKEFYLDLADKIVLSLKKNEEL